MPTAAIVHSQNLTAMILRQTSLIDGISRRISSIESILCQTSPIEPISHQLYWFAAMSQLISSTSVTVGPHQSAALVFGRHKLIAGISGLHNLDGEKNNPRVMIFCRRSNPLGGILCHNLAEVIFHDQNLIAAIPCLNLLCEVTFRPNKSYVMTFDLKMLFAATLCLQMSIEVTHGRLLSLAILFSGSQTSFLVPHDVLDWILLVHKLSTVSCMSKPIDSIRVVSNRLIVVWILILHLEMFQCQARQSETFVTCFSLSDDLLTFAWKATDSQCGFLADIHLPWIVRLLECTAFSSLLLCLHTYPTCRRETHAAK